MRRSVYNLEFPSWCPEITIFGYRFSRIDDYHEKVIRLQHLVNSSSEFHIPANNGDNVITAYVDNPENVEKAVLEWGGKDNTALADVLLLLSLFTQREVFAVYTGNSHEKTGVILTDSRLSQGGGILRCSIPYEAYKPDEIHMLMILVFKMV